MNDELTLTEQIESLAEKLGSRDFVLQKFEDLRSLLSDDGLMMFARLVDFFTTFDRSVSSWVLRSSTEILESMSSQGNREKILAEMLGMGRAKWTVVASVLQNLPGESELSFDDIMRWIRRSVSLADIDKDVAIQYLESCPSILEFINADRLDLWASLGQEIAQKSWKAAREYFRSSADVIKKIDHCDLERWARLGLRLIENSPRIKATYGVHSMLSQGIHAGKDKVLDLAVQYFRSAPQILGRLTVNDLEAWVEKGLDVVSSEHEKGEAYFSLRTGSSRDAVETLVKGIELKDIHSVLSKYVHSLTEKNIIVRSSSVFYKNLPGLSRYFTVSDGIRIFLPSVIDVFKDDEMNFKTYKCSLAHEVAHILFGTFDADPAMFDALSRFENPVQAFKIFEYLEDERVDHCMGLHYPGLEKDRLFLIDSYTEMVRSGGNGNKSVFAPLGYEEPDPKEGGSNEDRLTSLLNEALTLVRNPEQTVQGVFDLTIKICESIDSERVPEQCESSETYERVFYRGIIDFKLIEESRTGMLRILSEMLERFENRQRVVSEDDVKEALIRIEEYPGSDSDVLLWQIRDADSLNELFDRVDIVVTDIEEESRLRRTVFYDEWDAGLDDYKKEWCRVREIDMPSTTQLYYDETINAYYGLISLLRRHFGLLRPDRVKRYFREERGDDFDLDALIESIVERHAGVTPSDRVYIRRDKKMRDVSVAFLVDMSYSTGEELPSGKRIIDIEREALILMGEALESIGDRWAVYGFSTNYRDKIDFYVVRDFNEPFNDEVKMRFESIRPMAQTRLGAAIRHANSHLSRQDSLIRLLILLSDGRPYDIDYGDVNYSVEDTRMALWEGRSKGLTSYCITVDKRSREYLPHMYGESNYTIIDNVESLPTTLPLIYKKLTT
jgi:nitric oxide reductase NorD protein